MRVAPPSRYDLCISGDLSRDAMRACLQDARRLGYTVVALNRSVQRVTPTTKPPVCADVIEGLRVLTRLTLEDASSVGLASLSQPVVKEFDLVSVVVDDVKVLDDIVLRGGVHIITFDPAARLAVHVKRSTAMVAVERGVLLELRYAHALRDDSARRYFFSNLSAIGRPTRFKGVLLSRCASRMIDAGLGHDARSLSDARDALELRAPQDVALLAQLAGMPRDRSMECVSAAGDLVMKRLASQALHRGVARLVQPATVTVAPVPAAPRRKRRREATAPSAAASTASTPRAGAEAVPLAVPATEARDCSPPTKLARADGSARLEEAASLAQQQVASQQEMLQPQPQPGQQPAQQQQARQGAPTTQKPQQAAPATAAVAAPQKHQSATQKKKKKAKQASVALPPPPAALASQRRPAPAAPSPAAGFSFADFVASLTGAAAPASAAVQAGGRPGAAELAGGAQRSKAAAAVPGAATQPSAKKGKKKQNKKPTVAAALASEVARNLV